MQNIPLNSSPNQTFQCPLFIDGANRVLQFFIRFNEIAGYWVMRITDPKTSTILLDSVPMITGASNASANLLKQYGYLKIGSAFILNIGNVSNDPSDKDLGVNFLLIWGDTQNG